jgi:lipoprotein-anchoring transpeptidase ErfK/SrfK
VRTIGLFAIILAGSLFGACAANSAPAAGQVWSFQTPFGIIYGTIPREVVDYPSAHNAGTIVVSTTQRRLYYVLGGGKAIRYGIAVGMEGYAWSGVSTVSAKREWPDWTPTPGELQRFPSLPRHMAGGPDNPLGARALYLGETLYRIHGTNEPWKLGGGVSSGCIRMSNDDIVDLYNRTRIGATVIVQR